MTTTGSEPKNTGAKSTAPTVAADTAAGAKPPDPKEMETVAIKVVSPMSRAAKAAVVVIVAIVLGGAVFGVYKLAQSLSENDVAIVTQSPVVRYLATLTPTPAKPDVKPLASSITSADMRNPCRLLLKGFSKDFTKADLACLKSPDTFKGIAVTPDQAARFCYGIAEVNPVVGMACFSGMYRKALRQLRPNERPLDFVASSK